MKHPPSWADKILEWFCSEKYYEEVQGDLHEWFLRRVDKSGIRWAQIIYPLDVIRFISPFRIKSIENLNKLPANHMWIHYIKLSIRNSLKNKGISLQRLTNLSVGLTVALLTFLYIYYETGYERHFTQYHQIYRIQHNAEGTMWAATPLGLGEFMANQVVHVEKIVRVDPTQTTIRKDDLAFIEGNILLVDTTFFDVFDYQLLSGDRASILANPGSVVLTESMAAKYFGDEDPLGRTLIFDFDRGEPRLISGVMQDPSPQSHLQFGFLVPITTFGTENLGRWRNWGTYTYALMSPGFETSKSSIKEQILNEYVTQYRIPDKRRDQLVVHFIPLSDIHLKSNAEKEISQNSNIDYLYILGAAALLVLLISCINFLNLGLVSGFAKVREAGIRKAIGADRVQIYWQFLFDSFLYVGVSLTLALGVSYLILPLFKSFSGLELSWNQLLIPVVIIPLIALAVLIGWIGGGIPATRLARLRSADVIRSKSLNGFSLGRVGKLPNLLITLQLVISIGLISGSVVIYRQLQFVQDQELGFDREQVLLVPLTYEMGQQIDALKAEWKQAPAIDEVAVSSSVPGYRIMREVITNLQSGEGEESRLLLVGPDFINTYQIKLDSGRGFMESSPLRKEVILNHEAARILFEDQPIIGRYVSWGRDTAEVVGVVENFKYESLHASVMPLTIWLNPSRRYASIRFRASQADDAIRHINAKYREVLPSAPPLEPEFLSDRFENLYRAENKLQSLVWIFCAISILLTGTGIFGIASFTTQQRTKEIAIRKVLGGSTLNMIYLVSRPFAFMAIIASLIAFPLANRLVHWWLEDFAFRIEAGWGLLAISVVAIFIIIFVSTGYVSWKAAISNPVKNLQSE